MNLYGEWTESQVSEVIEATKLHPAVEAGRCIQYLSKDSQGVIRVGTVPKDNAVVTHAWDREFVVNYNGESYVVAKTFAEFS